MKQGSRLLRQGIGQRLFQQILVVSLVYTLASAALQFGLAYPLRLASVNGTLEAIETASQESLGTALWNADETLVQSLVQGILNFPFVSHVRVSDTAGGLIGVELGSPQPRDQTRSTILVFAQKDWVVPVGRLELTVNNERIFNEISGQTVSTLIFQAILVSFIALTVYQIFRRQVTVHLTAMADYLEKFNVAESKGLAVNKPQHNDEIDLLVSSFNLLRERLLAVNQEQRQSLERLHASESRYFSLIERAPDAILVYDPVSRRIISANNQAERLFGWPRDSLIRKTPEELYDEQQPDGRTLGESQAEVLLLVERVGAAFALRRILAADGRRITCEMRVARLYEAEQAYLRISLLDISARLEAEAAMQRSLHDKELLLQEVYHRTKNNLQVVAALLEMKAMLQTDAQTATLLQEMVHRIRTMALVHQKLYKSQDLSRIDLEGYVQDLAGLLADGSVAQERHFGIETEVGAGLSLLIDVVVPIGLIINELVTNSFKYAFPEEACRDYQDGCGYRVKVKARELSPGQLELIVSDNGCGMPAGFVLAKDAGMGLKTVQALVVNQLQGSLELLPGPGTAWRMVVNDQVYQSRI